MMPRRLNVGGKSGECADDRRLTWGEGAEAKPVKLAGPPFAQPVLLWVVVQPPRWLSGGPDDVSEASRSLEPGGVVPALCEGGRHRQARPLKHGVVIPVSLPSSPRGESPLHRVRGVTTGKSAVCFLEALQLVQAGCPVQWRTSWCALPQSKEVPFRLFEGAGRRLIVQLAGGALSCFFVESECGGLVVHWIPQRFWVTQVVTLPGYVRGIRDPVRIRAAGVSRRCWRTLPHGRVRGTFRGAAAPGLWRPRTDA